MDWSKQVVQDALKALTECNVKGTILYKQPLSYSDLLVELLTKIYTKTPLRKLIIVVDDNANFIAMKKYLAEQNDVLKSAINGKHLRLYTADWLIKLSYSPDNTIAIFLDDKLGSRYNQVLAKMDRVKHVVVLNYDTLGDLVSHVPVVYEVNKEEMIANKSLIKEINIPIELSEDNESKYNDYSAFISDCMAVFGDPATLMEAYQGNPSTGKSGEEIRYEIAISNGWKRDLDLDNPFEKRIDDMYSPEALFNRCKSFTEINQLRKLMISDAEEKIDAIRKIVYANEGKKILIISKRGAFADKIAEELNADHKGVELATGGADIFNAAKGVSYPYCGVYHNKIESSTLINPLTGQYFVNKGGAKAGQPKVFGAKMKSNLTLESFQKGYINVLSMTHKPYPDFFADVDLIVNTYYKNEHYCEILPKVKGIKPIGKDIIIYNIMYTPVEEEYTYNRSLKHSTVKTDFNSYDVKDY